MYPKKITDVARNALLEVCLALDSYKNDFVLSGGWAPYYLTKGVVDHCGSKDTDLMLRPSIMIRYDTIREIIIRIGYTETSSHFRFKKQFRDLEGEPFDVELDFLTEPDVSIGGGLQVVQDDLRAVFIPGVSIVFNHNYPLSIAGTLLGNGDAETTIKAADVAGSLITKGMALPRLKPKDSYDIYTVAGFYRGSPEAAAAAFNASFARGLNHAEIVSEAMTKIRNAFRTPQSFGCSQAVSFLGDENRRTDVFQRVKSFLDNVA